MADAMSQQITRLLGTGDWLILHSGHTLVTAEDLDALELADDVRASEAGDTEWDRLAQARQVWKVIRGAQADMLNGRPDMDAMEEIALSSAQMDDILDPNPNVTPTKENDHDR